MPAKPGALIAGTSQVLQWGAGDSVAADEELPPPPQNVQAKPGNGRVTITWDPVPDAMYYNLYFQTTKGVQIKFSELTRPIASAEDFKAVIGVKKDKATCLEGATSPFLHDDLANRREIAKFSARDAKAFPEYEAMLNRVAEDGVLVDYDGVMALPSEAVSMLRAYGFTVPEDME